MSITIAALQYCAGDNPTATLSHIEPMITKAAKTADLVCLPEAADFLAANRTQLQECAEWEDDSSSTRKLALISKENSIWLLAGSLFLRKRQNNQLVNRSVLFDPLGEIIATYDKIHMFDANVGDGKRYRESDSFSPGKTPVIASIKNFNLGMTICYDLRFPNLYRQLALDGAHILAVPAAFTAITGAVHWHTLLQARAIETGCYVIAPAQYGTHGDGRQTYGHALIVSPWGKILAEAKNKDAVITANIDLKRVAEARQAIPSLFNSVTLNQTKFGND